MKRYSSYWWLPLLFVLAACQGTGTPPSPGMKVGKPYVIEGKTYYPSYDPTYDKIGQASWYGPGFHGKYTANGEVFNQNDLTAAHPTLPMPSLVRVTNLTNGKHLIVRINDRGPFKSNRIIDLSKKSAQKLGITSLAQVRVQYLKEETEQHLASLQSGGRKVIDMAALNNKTSAPEPSGQIVENTVASTSSGQIVSSAAPVMSVRSGELDQPEEHAKPEVSTSEEKSYAEYNPSVGSKEKDTQAAPKKTMEVTLLRNAEASPTPIREESIVAKKARVPTYVSNAFYIQAGSFSAEENAQKLSSRLEGIGEVIVGKIEVGEKTWWRVRVGPFDSHQEASSALNKVHAAGVPDAKVVNL